MILVTKVLQVTDSVSRKGLSRFSSQLFQDQLIEHLDYATVEAYRAILTTDHLSAHPHAVQDFLDNLHVDPGVGLAFSLFAGSRRELRQMVDQARKLSHFVTHIVQQVDSRLQDEPDILLGLKVANRQVLPLKTYQQVWGASTTECFGRSSILQISAAQLGISLHGIAELGIQENHFHNVLKQSGSPDFFVDVTKTHSLHNQNPHIAVLPWQKSIAYLFQQKATLAASADEAIYAAQIARLIVPEDIATDGILGAKYFALALHQYQTGKGDPLESLKLVETFLGKYFSELEQINRKQQQLQATIIPPPPSLEKAFNLAKEILGSP